MRVALRCGIGLLLVGAAAAAAAQSPFERARNKGETAIDRLNTVPELVKAGKAEQAETVQGEAMDLLEEARELYRANNVLEEGAAADVAKYADFLTVTYDYDLAAQAYERAAELAPNDAHYALNAGLARVKLGPGQGDKALAHFDRALAIAEAPPVQARAHAGRGDVYWEQGIYDFARQAYEKALKLNESNPRAVRGAGLCFARRGDVQRGAELIDSLGVMSPRENAEFNARLRSALEDFQRDRMWFRDTAANHLAYAKLLFRVGRNPECLLAVERSIGLDDQNAEAWLLLGSTALRVGQQGRAREAFQRSLELNPDQPEVRQVLNNLPNPNQ